MLIVKESIPVKLPGAGRTTDQQSQNDDFEDVFGLLISNIKDYAIFMIDPGGFVVSWNKGAEKIKGYTASEIIGKHISLFYSEADNVHNLPALNLERAALAGNFECEGWRVRKGGSQFWANVSFTAVHNDDGSLKGFAKVTRDITEKKNNENKVAYLAKLIERTSDAIFSYTASYEILSWNEAAENLYGYTAKEALHKNVAELLGTEANAGARQQIRKNIAEKKSWAGEVYHKRKDGSLIPVYVSVTATRDRWDNSEQFVCVCRDITEKKEAEDEAIKLQAEANRLTQEKLDYSQKQLSDYKYALDKACTVAITDKDGVIIYANEHFCNNTKYTPGELIGQTHRIINSGYHPKSFFEEMWDTIAAGQVWKGEIKNKAKDGTFYWVDTTIVPFLDEQGQPYQYLAIRVDISERKKAEEELGKLNEHLEERVKSRTRQFEIANRELESFSYSVSHDLRAPLRAISGFSKILQEDHSPVLDTEGNRLLARIITNAETMGQLIDDLLTFSRTGRKELTTNAINMQALAESCVNELASAKGNNICAIEIQNLAECTGDISLIKQVWLNLIANAIKYSSKNTAPAILIGSQEGTDRQVYFIQDNGVGFDMQYAHKLFGVFQRLHSNEEFEGTGVGLALVKLIVNKHHGEVWADAQLGKGATFYFSLPKKIVV